MSRLKDVRGLKYPEEYIIRFFFKNGLHNRPGRVLEAGCANGCNLRLFREYDWETVGIDIGHESLLDAQANFSSMTDDLPAYRFVEHDLTQGLPHVDGPFDAVLFPSSLYYIPRQSMVRVLCDARRLVRPDAVFYLRMRTLADFRYGRGEPTELNGFRLTLGTTGEYGLINVFYHEYELVEMLRDHLGAEPAQMKILRLDYENIQNDVTVANSDVVIWGHLPH